jgi:hypothetical protein
MQACDCRSRPDSHTISNAAAPSRDRDVRTDGDASHDEIVADDELAAIG